MVNNQLIIEEILLRNDDLIYSTAQYECYLFEYDNIPNIIYEIGRLREITFTAVGEGSNNVIDLDEYDKYYKHLVLWDSQDKKIVGAYRIGFADEILKDKGLSGLYSHSLFNYSDDFIFELNSSIELGRSFVAIEYQKEALPLMLLLKGIMYVVINRPQVKYLIGPASISAWYPLFYQSLICHYIQKNYSLDKYQHYIEPSNPFQLNFNDINVDELLNSNINSIEKFDRFICYISDYQYKLPPLLKKYLKINAKIIGYNVDKNFNYCVDGLIFLQLSDIPKREIDLLTREIKDKSSIYQRFQIDTLETTTY